MMLTQKKRFGIQVAYLITSRQTHHSALRYCGPVRTYSRPLLAKSFPIRGELWMELRGLG